MDINEHISIHGDINKRATRVAVGYDVDIYPACIVVGRMKAETASARLLDVWERMTIGRARQGRSIIPLSGGSQIEAGRASDRRTDGRAG